VIQLLKQEASGTPALNRRAAQWEEIMAKRKPEGPVTIKEALSENVRRQQRRSSSAASPPEAQRSPRERVKSAEEKRKHH
jgi:hypothetical protein